MILSRAGLPILLGLLLVQAGVSRHSVSSPSTPTKPQPRPGAAAQRLIPGRSLDRELASGEEHRYLVPLAAEDFLFLEIDQRGIDAVVTLLDPAGRLVIRMNGPDGRRGKKPVCAVAGVSGPHLLKVSGKGAGWQGSYRLAVRELRKPTKADRACDSALRTLVEGDDLKEKQPEQAIEKYRSAERTWAAAGNAWGQVLALERLGSLLTNEGELKEALSSYDRALPLARALGDRRREAHLTSRASVVHFYKGDLVQARALALAALAIAEEEGDLDVQASTRNILAMVSRGLGRVQDALASYRIALELWQRLNEPAWAARVLINRSELYMTLGLPDPALASLNQAWNLLQREDKRDVRCSLLTSAGAAHHLLEDRKRAMRTYERALTLARTPREQAVIFGRIAMVLRDDGRMSKAISFLERSRELARRQGSLRGEAYALADLAHIEDLRGREAEAIEKFNQALKIVTELEETAVMASVLFGRAEAEGGRGRLDEAIASVEESIELIEALRKDLNPELRIAFFASRHRAYDLYVGLLMEQHRRDPAAEYQARAFEVGERSRSRSLLDNVAGRPGAAAMTLSEIQKEVLDRGSVLLSYRLGKPKSTLWVVTPGSLTSFDLPSREEIEEEAARVREKLSKGARVAETGALSRMLLPTGIGPLGRKRLLIVPDGVLHLVPFASLCDPALPQGGCRTRAPLVLDHEVVHLPSASVLGRMRQKLASRRPASGYIGVLADPVFQRDDSRLVERIGEPDQREPESGLGIERLQRLPFTHKEAKEILKLFPAEERFSALDFSASRETAMSAAFVRNRILHFATHNLVEDHPDLSGLVLSRFDEGGRPVDGFLGVKEIYDLELAADLVVLSACGTGLGREVRGEGVLGLTRAFLHSGAKRVVVSLWNVREAETAELMTRFYRKLRDGLAPAAALRSAQASMSSDGYPPRSWAGFVLQGEPR